jgi:hypothetical protein
MSRHDIWFITLALLALLLPGTSFAQEIPDPNRVAPEYRDLAEHRRAEIIGIRACTNKAGQAKVLKRDMAAYINQCMAEAEKARQVESEPKAKN